MKSYERIAQSMYDDYRANHIHKLAEWHQLTQMHRDCWIAAAKTAHKEITEVHEMSNEKPEALELADILENLAHPTGTRHRAATELRRQHARIQELEAMLESIGAGGVSAQRVTQAKDHIEQPIEMVAAPVVLPEPDAWAAVYFSGKQAGKIYTTCDTKEQVEVYIHQVHQSNDSITLRAEPIYMRAAPQPQADARDAELVAAVVYASTEAMNSSLESPSFDGSIILESHHAASLILALDELQQHRAAIAAAKEMK